MPSEDKPRNSNPSAPGEADGGNAEELIEPTSGPNAAPNGALLHVFAAGSVPEAEMKSEEASLPQSYGADSIGAIARKPGSLFVYWELSGDASMRLREKLDPGIQWELILENSSGNRSAEIPVDPDAQNYYLNVESGQRYVIKLGVVIEGSFRPVCPAVSCRVPNKPPSDSRENMEVASGDRENLEWGEGWWTENERILAETIGFDPFAARTDIPGLAWDPDLLVGSSSSYHLASTES
ncbi:MAG: DUF4912 domain-containing protein [Candidatus Brocadiia bacterium]